MDKNINRLIKKYRKYIRGFAALAGIALMFGGMLLLVSKWEKHKFPEAEDSETSIQSLNANDTIRYNGKWYTENEEIEKILIIGLDKYEKAQESEYYTNNMQADFLALVCIDNHYNVISILSINRDTMADVEVLGLGNKSAGTNMMQLALSHTYGSGGNDSCLNTVKAVSNMLYGLTIDHYVSLTMDAVAKINDGFGGVSVTVKDDFSSIDDTLIQGQTVTLHGEHALNFVRTRQGLDDSSNINRMERQKEYINGLIAKAKEQYKENDEDFFFKILFSIADDMTSDLTISQQQELGNRIAEYRFIGINSIEGETKKGFTFTEFYPDEEALKELIINQFYISD